MISLATFTAPLKPCGYLPDREWQLEYEVIAQMTPREYEQRMEEGWRHFGHWLFHPKCPSCSACVSLRIRAADFAPNRSQRRALRDNADVELQVGEPAVSDDRIALHERFHEYRSDARNWPFEGAKDPEDYASSFVQNPFPIEEWRYWIGDRCVALGYVDRLPNSLSLIYFFHEPEFSGRSLGTLNVLRAVEEARRCGLAYVYTGYYVRDCQSLSYKNNFRPNEGFIDGAWRPHGSRGGGEAKE